MIVNLQSSQQAKHSTRRGYVLLEIIIAFGLFATVSVALVKALNMTGRTASTIRHEMQITQVLQSAMTDALSEPNLQEGEYIRDYAQDVTGDEESFFRGTIETIVTPMEELENEDGQLLQNMFKINVTFYWTDETGEEQQQSVETWRYASLYRP
ncbi:MAG: PulJ/GspJ family protein [Akkermansiaceae bacterium]